MFRAKMTRHIHFSDCDPAQIVFYPRYYVWFDQATESMFRAVGLNWEDMFEPQAGGFAGVPLLGASASFKSACKMGDDVVIESWIEQWEEKTFVVKHHLRNDDRVAVEGEEVRIWVVRAPDRPAGIKAAPIPDEIKLRFSGD